MARGSSCKLLSCQQSFLKNDAADDIHVPADDTDGSSGNIHGNADAIDGTADNTDGTADPADYVTIVQGSI